MKAPESITFLIGRILLCLIFLGSGFNKIMNFEATMGKMEQVGMPLVGVGIAVAIVVELVAAVCVMIGFKMRWAALALVLYVLTATYFFHNPLVAENPQAQTIQLMKNLSIIGGLLLIAALGRGPFSIEK